MPGPDIPPNLLPIAGRKVSVLIFRPSSVFEMVSASAPAFSAALAIGSMSPALGESFAHSGLSVARRTRPTTVVGVVFVQREVAAVRIARRAGNVHLDDVNLGQVDVARHRLEILGGRAR